MRRIRLCAPAHATPVEIPSPHLVGHLLKRTPGRHLLGLIVPRPNAPVSLLAAERGNPTLGRDSSAGEPEGEAGTMLKKPLYGVVEHPRIR